MLSGTSIGSILFDSRGLAVEAYGFDVEAPTGRGSITLPDNSGLDRLGMCEPTSVLFPLPVVPDISTPAISVADRMRRVQWVRRVIIVLVGGPLFLSSDDLLYS